MFNPRVMQEFNIFRQNPQQYLANRNINIPSEYMNNYQDAVQYLVDNGRIPQNVVDQFRRMFNF